MCWVKEAAGVTRIGSLQNLPLKLLLQKRVALRASASAQALRPGLTSLVPDLHRPHKDSSSQTPRKAEHLSAWTTPKK